MSYTLHCEYVRTWNNSDNGGAESHWDHVGDYVKLSDAKTELQQIIDKRSSMEGAVIIDNETERVKVAWDVTNGYN
jgi:hypothetical protein